MGSFHRYTCSLSSIHLSTQPFSTEIPECHRKIAMSKFFLMSIVLASSCIERVPAFFTQLPAARTMIPTKLQQHRRIVSHRFNLHTLSRPSARTTTPTALKSSPGGNDDSGSETAATARPDPSILLSAKSDSEQKLGVASIGAGILLGALLLTSFLGWLNTVSGGFLGTILDFVVPLPLGLIFTFVGATHFFYKDEYAAIVPPKGSWGGLWNVPTPGADKLGLSDEEYHVLWSGVAEVGGGLLLILGGLNAIPVQIPAFLLFALTLAVTPANIYMYTHDAPLAFAPPLRYPDDHIGRGVVQIILLSLFGYLATHG